MYPLSLSWFKQAYAVDVDLNPTDLQISLTEGGYPFSFTVLAMYCNVDFSFSF